MVWLGYAKAGGTTESLENQCSGSMFTVPATMRAISISAYITPSVATFPAQGAIYLHSNLSLVAQTAEVTMTAGAGWKTFTFPSPPTLTAGTEYIVVVWADSLAGTCLISYDNLGAANQGHTDANVYAAPAPAFANPMVPTHNTFLYSVYVSTVGIYPTDAFSLSDDTQKKIFYDWDLIEAFSFGDPVTVTKVSPGKTENKTMSTEVYTLGDTLSKALKCYKTLSTDGLAFGDPLSKPLSRFRSYTDGLTLGEVFTALKTTITNKTISTDAFNYADYFAAFTRRRNLLLIDALIHGEQLVFRKALAKYIGEAYSLKDDPSKGLRRYSWITDTYNFGDPSTLAKIRVTSFSLTDALQASDPLGKYLSRSQTFTDAYNFGDALSTQAALALSLTEAYGFADALATQRTINQLLTEGYSVYDLAEVIKTTPALPILYWYKIVYLDSRGPPSFPPP